MTIDLKAYTTLSKATDTKKIEEVLPIIKPRALWETGETLTDAEKKEGINQICEHIKSASGLHNTGTVQELARSIGYPVPFVEAVLSELTDAASKSEAVKVKE